MARRTNNRKFNGNQNSNSSKARAQHKQSSTKSKSSSVEIYTASFCPHCQDAKMYMKLNKIKFTEYNLEKSKGAEKKFLAMGGKKIPLIVVKGNILRSWNQAAFEKAYNA
ncbi:glutaredoxin family protein [Campylobacterota bacterium]